MAAKENIAAAGSESMTEPKPREDTLLELSQYEPYVKPGLRGMFQSKYVVACSFLVRLGGFLFGYDQVGGRHQS